MKRATALKVLAATLTVLMVASAFPLTQVLLNASFPGGSSSALGKDASSSRSGGATANGALPFGPAIPDAGWTAGSGAAGGILPGVGLAGSVTTGSALLDQVLGAAQVMGIHARLPDLPLDQLAPVDPLRPAILAWIAATNAQVPPAELQRELAHADALPQDEQRDLAILILSASAATTLQREALAALTPEQIAWLHSHPEVAQQLVAGKVTPETQYAASLSNLVDNTKSVEAALLVLEAVEATRGSLGKDAQAEAAKLLAHDNIDASTESLLQLLAAAPTGASDAEKVRYAARLVAATSGVSLPAEPVAIPFADAVTALASATHQVPDASAMQTALARADALPQDLQDAISLPLKAEADAILASTPGHITSTSQPQALVGVLLATAKALPTLEKYQMYWRETPSALRVGQWDPAQRSGWALYHAALLASTRGDPVAAVQTGALLQGLDMPDVGVVKMTLPDAYAAMVQLRSGRDINATLRKQVDDVSATLAPNVRDAATLMLSGAVESARLTNDAWARVSPADHEWVLGQDVTSLYTKTDITDSELATLARFTRIADQVDRSKIAAAEIVGVRATMEAKKLLAPTYATQANDAHTLTFWDTLARLLPWQMASAQSNDGVCVQLPGLQAAPVGNDCDKDILLQLQDPFSGSFCFDPTDPTTCDGSANNNNPVNAQILVISGLASMTYAPKMTTQTFMYNCRSTGPAGNGNGGRGTMQDIGPVHIDPRNGDAYIDDPTTKGGRITLRSSGSGNTGSFTCDQANVPVPQMGQANVWIDLGGSDTYDQPVASTAPYTFTGALDSFGAAAHLHLDVGGNDQYLDPTDLYIAFIPWQYQYGFSGTRALNAAEGYATQGSAAAGGVAVLVDAGGTNTFTARGKSQGFGQWGLGMLASLGGEDDIYEGRTFVQGAASSDMNTGLGILLDAGGDDTYRAQSGQGYGLGGLLLDLAGHDVYRQTTPPMGMPIAHLDVLPGGNLTETSTRGDDRIWMDGPATLNAGIAVDVELPLSIADSDNDLFPDFAEFLVGTNPNDPTSNPRDDPTARTRAIATDGDHDTYPDFIERALGTDPANPLSYPAGIPRGPTIGLPLGLGDATAGDELNGTAPDQPERSDKIIDLRLPLQNAGSIDYACAGSMYFNDTGRGFASGLLSGIGALEQSFGYTQGSTTTPNAEGPCVIVTYHPNGDGTGEANVKGGTPANTPNGYGSVGPITQHGANSSLTNEPQFDNFTFQLPAGILAVGDAVDTKYDIDYFFVVDLGGDDHFASHAGGALGIVTAPARASSSQYNDAFFAPSIVLNVDLDENGNVTTPAGDVARVSSQNMSQGFDVYETPVNDTGDYSQGAMWSLLLDTGGNDIYRAGSASQGAEGGILLDLAGKDSYTARNLSQGADYGTASPPGTTNVPTGGTRQDFGGGPSGQTNGDGGLRRATPGILLDFGSDSDTYRAAAASQGFARNASAPAAATIGILLDTGGDDVYDTAAAHGAASQGVGTTQGVGFLVDLAGNDTYRAWTATSQGATVSQVYGTTPAGNNNVPGAGFLVDIGGHDQYLYNDTFGAHDRTRVRQDNLTITRGDLESTNNHVYAAPGIHLDSESDATALASAVFGTGGRDFTNALDIASQCADDPTGCQPDSGLYVDMPNAGLAIGNANATNYTNEYALVIDLGGANHYAMNAGGVFPALLYSDSSDPANFAPYHNQLALFPVTLLVDAGTDGSTYTANRGLVQGAGFFSVGIVADLGGNDTFVAAPSPIASLGADWIDRTIIPDGTMGATEWANTRTFDITMGGTRDPSLREPATMRIGNDARNIYIAIRGHSSAVLETRPNYPVSENLSIDLNVGHSGKWWTDAASGLNQTLVDDSTIQGIYQCTARDGYYSKAGVLNYTEFSGEGGDLAHATDTNAGCSIGADGNYTIEIVKPLRAQFPFQNSDLDLPYDPALGYTIRDLGIRVQLSEGNGSMETFAWPPGTVRDDGAGSYTRDTASRNLTDELRDWAVLDLANLGQAGVAPTVTKLPALAQGAGVAGIGILAMLGDVDSSANLTSSDKSQGYGAAKGLGLVIDLGGSDFYDSNTASLGAADDGGLGAIIDLDGNDNYRCAYACLGYAPDSKNALGLFMDLGGSDQYNVTQRSARDARPCIGTLVTGCDPLVQSVGVVHAWSTRPGNAAARGFGVDLLSEDGIRQIIAGTVGNRLYGDNRVNITLEPTKTDGSCKVGGTVPTRPISPTASRMVLTGKVCLVATVNLLQGTADVLGTAGNSITVDSVDFLVDSARVATVNVPDDIPATGIWVYRTPIDVAGYRDGVSRVTASTVLRTNIEGRGTVLFYDRSIGASLPVLIDNPSFGALCTYQKLPVISQPCNENMTPAYFSPIASDPATPANLLINWSVAHDSQEDRLNLVQGWSPEDYGRAVPCDTANMTVNDTDHLCDIIPLYFKAGTGGPDWNTQRGTYSPSERASVFVQRNGLDGVLVQDSVRLTTNLTILKDQGFHVYLSNRTPILPSNYNTTLVITLRDSLGHRVNVSGEDVTLANVTFEADGLSPSGNAIVSGLAQDNAKVAFDTAHSATDQVMNLFHGPIQTILDVVDTACGNAVVAVVDHPPSAGGPWPHVCDYDYYGNRDYQGDRQGLWVPLINISACDPNQNSTTYRQLGAALHNEPACDPTLNQTAHEQGAGLDQTLGGQLGSVGDLLPLDLIQTTLFASDRPSMNWTDLVVERLNDTSSDPEATRCVKDLGDRLEVQPTCSIELELWVTTSFELGGKPGDITRSTWDSTVTSTVNDELDNKTLRPLNHPVDDSTGQQIHDAQCTGRPTAPHNVCDAAIVSTLNSAVPGSRIPVNTTGSRLGDTVGAVNTLGGIPFAFFRLGMPTDLSRLDIKVPAEPFTSTTTTLTIERDDDARSIAKTVLPTQRIVGDWAPTLNNQGSPGPTDVDNRTLFNPLNGQRYLTYNASAGETRFTQHAYNWQGDGCDGACPDGVYIAHLKAQDDTQLSKKGTDLETSFDHYQPIVLDRTAPESHIVTNGFAGSALLDGNRLPITWRVDHEDTPPVGVGSGVKQVWLWYHKGPIQTDNLTDAERWTAVNQGHAFPAAIDSWLDSDLDSTKTDYYFITVAEDRVGNVEGLVRGDIPDRADILSNLGAPGDYLRDAADKAFHDLSNTADGMAKRAFYGKLLHGDVDHIFVDPTRPVRPTTGPATFVVGGHQLNYRGVDSYFVRAGESIKFQACAGDLQSGVRQVNFVFDHVDPVSGNVTTRSFNGAPDGACGIYTRFVYAGWSLVDTNKTVFPDGAWTVTAEVFDQAGNRLQIPIANVVLDSVAPNVTIQPAEFPPGQSAVKPGDRLTLRFLASDELGLDEPGLTLDASRLSTEGRLLSCQAQGAAQDCIRQVRRNGITYEEVSFKVDAAGLQNTNYTVPVTVLDNAGNSVTLSWLIPVDFSRFTIVNGTVRATDTTHNSTIVRWTTTDPTSSAVRFGTSPTEMKVKTATNLTATTEHEVLVDGLQASTRYFLRVVSSTPGGYTLESDTIDTATETALYLEGLTPAAGSAVSGAVPVHFRGGLLDATSEYVTYTLEAQSAHDQPWQFVTTLTEQGTDHQLTFNSTRYLDGNEYRLRITAAYGHDSRVAGLGPFLSDNTPPEVSVVGPLYATNDTTPSVSAEARDNLAGFASGAAALLIDGAEAANLTATPSSDGVRIEYAVPNALAPGVHTFELDVKDKAGNVAPNVWQVSVDGDAPVVSNVVLHYVPGPEAAKLGGTVTIDVTALDASGVASIVGDTSDLADQPLARFTHVVGGDHWVATIPVAVRDDTSTRHVALTITDRAGNVALAGADIIVDNLAPRLTGEVRAVDIGLTTATLTTDANEPVLLLVTATAPKSPPVTAATTELSAHPSLQIKGLLPSREYTFAAQLLDRAGNEVDASGKIQMLHDLKAPTRVLTFEVQDMLNGTLHLSWTAATDDVGIAFYRVYRSDDGVAYRILQEVDGLATFDPNLPLEKNFTYKVVAVDYGSNEGPASDAIRASATAVPHLSAGLVTPTVGDQATVFQYIVTYTSPSGVKPNYVHALIDGAAHDMRPLDPATGTYVYETNMPPHKRDAPHTFAYEASDGRYTARFPEDGSTLRGPLVSGDAAPQGGVAGLFGARSVPAGGVVGAGIAIIAAAGIVTLIVRRKREGSK